MAALITDIVKDSDWLLKKRLKKMVKKATMESQTEATMWKNMKRWVRDLCQKRPCILFKVTYQENRGATKQKGEKYTTMHFLPVLYPEICH